jgi:hypothetical protein
MDIGNILGMMSNMSGMMGNLNQSMSQSNMNNMNNMDNIPSNSSNKPMDGPQGVETLLESMNFNQNDTKPINIKNKKGHRGLDL